MHEQRQVLLLALQRFAPLTVSELAQAVDANRNWTAGAVERLVGSGFVVRRRAAAAPLVLLTLTPAGQQYLRRTGSDSSA